MLNPGNKPLSEQSSSAAAPKGTAAQAAVAPHPAAASSSSTAPHTAAATPSGAAAQPSLPAGIATYSQQPVLSNPVGTVTGGLPAVPKPPGSLLPLVSVMNLRRIPSAVDPLGTSAQGLENTLNSFRLASATKVFGGLQRIKQHVDLILTTLQQTKLPPTLIGAVHQPDGGAAARVQVQLQSSTLGVTASPVTVLTADDGGFKINVPTGAMAPPTGLALTVHGANANATVTVPTDGLAANGMIGVLTLPTHLSPLPVSIIAALAALMPTGAAAAPLPAAPTDRNTPTVTIGEAGSVCVQSFAASSKVDKFPWGIFFRIVEPHMSIVSETQAFPSSNGRFNWLPVYVTQNQTGAIQRSAAPATQTSYVDRIPVDQPLSVDGFRDQVAGIDPTGTFSADEKVPMAASLGLGYVLQMSQQWTFKGLGLGDLVYSLPLAPGEQQQMAVFERKDTTAVQETEFFSESEAMSQAAMSDTSTNATFNSAFNEAVAGGSQFQTDSQSSSSGWTAIFASGGSGSSSATGNSSSWLQGQRDTTQQAAEATHSSAENQASARVTANRTGMRLATASESMDVTTKIITNHNHNHALTMQYWEVHRIYDVATAIDGLTLVCLVPMQIVRFMPPGQPATISDPSQIDNHVKLLSRYANILRHMDILQMAVPRRFRHGLTLLAQFASDPTSGVDSSGTVAEDVISFKISGTFLACETISVVAVTKRNTRVGPVQLAPVSSGQPTPIPQNEFTSRDDLIAWLTMERQSGQTLLQGSLALPSSMNRSDIIGFEITRQFMTVNCTLVNPAIQAIKQLLGIFGTSNTGWEQSNPLLASVANGPVQTIVLAPSTLENLLGGAALSYFYAAIEDINAAGQNVPSAKETYANDNLGGTVLPPQPFPVPALQIAPVLRYHDILEIEKTAQHIVRNTTRYSRVLWMSMTDEERAILLDGYTIGVPQDGLEDASQMIPLLNCVQNRVLGTFGNSLIMPFMIPADVAESMELDPAVLQQALLSYQRENFVPPHSTIALPTRGVLGEAVLGHCASAEKIDLTRFWNWQDAPADTAPGIGMVQLPTTTPPLTTGVTAPNSLTNLPPLINNLITAPQPNTSLLQAMGQQAASQQDFSTNLTGQQQLASMIQNGQTLANQARSDALKTSQSMTSQLLTTVGNLVGQSMKQGGGGGQSSKPPAQTPNANQTAGGKSGTSATPGAAGTGGASTTGGNAAAGAATPAASAGDASSTGAIVGDPSTLLGSDPLGVGTLSLDPSLVSSLGGGAGAGAGALGDVAAAGGGADAAGALGAAALV